MMPMRFFVDTHDKSNQSFPENLTPEQFEQFFEQYERACRDENVIILRLHVGYQEGRAFCFTMATDAEAVRRAHERVGLPFDSITEVATATPGDTFFRRSTTAA